MTTINLKDHYPWYTEDAFAKLRNRNVTICARMQSASGEKVVPEVPSVIPSLAAHRTAL